MAYSEYTADRITHAFADQNTRIEVKKFMGGWVAMVDDKMCMGTHTDKKTGQDLLMVRIGEEAMPEAAEKEGCLPMDFTGRPMKGYVFVEPIGYDTDEQLAYWVSKALAFNPLAKSSKRKKK